MGIFSKPKAPAAPDPATTAATQAGYNQQAAQNTLKMNAMNRGGPFGSSTFERDSSGMPTGINTSFNPTLQSAFDTIGGNLQQQAGGIPTSINFDDATPGAIFGAGVNAYNLANEPLRNQQNENLNVRLAERGIPLNSEISNNEWGNLQRQQGAADAQAFATLANAVPQNMATMTNNNINQAMAPGALTGQGIGLMGAGLGLLPQAQQPQAQVGNVDYSGLVGNNYKTAMQQYGNDMQGFGNMIQAGTGLLTGPVFGKEGGSILGAGLKRLGGLFNDA